MCLHNIYNKYIVLSIPYAVYVFLGFKIHINFGKILVPNEHGEMFNQNILKDGSKNRKCSNAVLVDFDWSIP